MRLDPTRFTFISNIGQGDIKDSAPVGGEVGVYTAHTTTLLVGDAVYLHGVGIVNKSATVTLYTAFIGYVVGGESTGMLIDDVVGTTAATSGQKVLVQTSGIARAIVGATGFTAGTNVEVAPSSATAGRVIPNASVSNGHVLGVALSTQATAGSELKVLIRHRTVSLAGSMFVSAETTSTGSAQNVAHGLGYTPTKIFVAPTELPADLTGGFDVAEGTHTSTNVVLTVTASCKFKVLAW